MTWSLASYAANGTQGFGVLRQDGGLEVGCGLVQIDRRG